MPSIEDRRYFTCPDDLFSTENGVGASLIGIEDASAYYTADNVEGLFDELEAQIGGDTSTTFDFTEANVLTDNDAIYAALEKLDLKWGDLASTANTEGASLVSVEDASTYYTGTDVETVLDELEAQIGGDTSATFDFTEANVLTDNDAIYAALEKLDLKWGDLASTANTEGASLVSIEDSASQITGTTVEAALAEVFTHVHTAQAVITPTAITLENGTPIPQWADGAADGWYQEGNEDVVLKWNTDANPSDMAALFHIPNDLDDGEDVVVHFLGTVTATTDTPKMVVEAYFAVAGAAINADTDCGGESTAFANNTNLEEKTVTLASSDVPAAPAGLTIVFHPKDGELGTDDFILSSIWLEYTRQTLTS